MRNPSAPKNEDQHVLGDLQTTHVFAQPPGPGRKMGSSGLRVLPGDRIEYVVEYDYGGVDGPKQDMSDGMDP